MKSGGAYRGPVRQEVQWYLAEGLAAIRAQPGSDSTERRQLVFASFGAKLDALRYVEEISEEERLDWHNRLLIALGIEPLPPAEPGTVRGIWLGLGTPPAPAPRTPPPAFLRSWPGPDQEWDYHGGRFRVIALELYDTMLNIRWRVAPEPDLTAVFPAEAAQLARDVAGVDEWAQQELQRKAERLLRMRRLFRFALQDDLGTEYLHRGGGSHGGSGGTTGEAEFVPIPPPNATRLELSWLDLIIELPIE